MNHDILNKWTIGAIGMLMLFAAACYLYYHQTTAHDREQAAQAEKLLQEWEANKEPKPTIEADQDSTQTPAENTTKTAEKPTIIIGEERTETNTDKPSKTVTIATPETDNTEEVRVSPHGFGPYPKIPDGYPVADPFDDEMGRDFELMQRVRIKLFNEQGFFADGLSISEHTGLVTYITRDVIWVEWGTTNIPGQGEQRYAASIRGHPATMAVIEENVKNRESSLPVKIGQITEADIPSDITIKSGSEAIDPYQFLNLTRQSTHTNF